CRVTLPGTGGVMAGRRPSQTPDDEAGVTPLRPGGQPRRGTRRVSGVGDDGEWEPAFPGQRPPFEQGNSASKIHGSRSPKTVAQLADEILRKATANTRAMPGHLRSPAFEYSVLAWARAEAVAELLWRWLEHQDVDFLVIPRSGAQRAPLETYSRAVATAKTLRSQLGLDPV